MVRQEVGQTYTYYQPDGGVNVIRDAPLVGLGKAWVEGAYVPPVYPSPLNVRVGNSGIKVWIVIKWLRFYKGDVDKVLTSYAPTLNREDVDAALAYFKGNEQAIEEKLRDESGAI